jgi:hypothetical protein
LGQAPATVLEREITDATVSCASAAATIALRPVPATDAVLLDAAHSNRPSANKISAQPVCVQRPSTAVRVLRWAAWAGVDFCCLRRVVR